jgi:pimeloyl-ACP methyl ester carboxylesterase
MSDDYETIVKNETKTTIALCFTVDHPELVHKLVLAMTGYRLSDGGSKLQRKIIDTTRQKKWERPPLRWRME